MSSKWLVKVEYIDRRDLMGPLVFLASSVTCWVCKLHDMFVCTCFYNFNMKKLNYAWKRFNTDIYSFVWINGLLNEQHIQNIANFSLWLHLRCFIHVVIWITIACIVLSMHVFNLNVCNLIKWCYCLPLYIQHKCINTVMPPSLTGDMSFIWNAKSIAEQSGVDVIQLAGIVSAKLYGEGTSQRGSAGWGSGGDWSKSPCISRGGWPRGARPFHTHSGREDGTLQSPSTAIRPWPSGQRRHSCTQK